MVRIVRFGAFGLGGVVAILLLLLLSWHLIDETPTAASPLPAGKPFDASQLLVLVDGDMAATAYADGVLHPVADAQDQLVVLSDLASPSPAQAVTPTSNTVLGWPGSMTASPAGSLAYVVASRTAIDRSIQAFDGSVWEGLPVGRILTTVDLASNAILSEIEVCSEPLSVDLAPNGLWLLIACRDSANELTVVELIDGLPNQVRPLNLDVSSEALRDISLGATYAVVHPSGTAAGVVLNDHEITLVRFELDENGVPNSAQAETPLTTNRWLSVARWTHSGNHLLVADVAWGPAPTDAVFNGPGAILSVALSPDSGERGIVSEATVSKSPEAFEMNRDGDLLAVVNMERTYLPGGPLSLVPGRAASSLSLVGVDDLTGALTTFGKPIGFSGVLPEDAVFDSDGDQIAVVVYQDHDAPQSDGWISFFDIDATGPEPKAVLTDRRIPLPRGGHDLFVVD